MTNLFKKYERYIETSEFDPHQPKKVKKPKGWDKYTNKYNKHRIIDSYINKGMTMITESRYKNNEWDNKVTSEADAATKEFHKIMKSKGYKHSSSKQSAQINHDYTKGDHRVVIHGWHGSGSGNRDYGGVKNFHGLYDSKSGDYKPVLTHDTGESFQDENGGYNEAGYKDHQRMINDIRKHLNKVGSINEGNNMELDQSLVDAIAASAGRMVGFLSKNITQPAVIDEVTKIPLFEAPKPSLADEIESAGQGAGENLDEAKGDTIEAYGVKGMNSTSWRKSFKHRAHLDKWADQNDAEIHGTRNLEQAKRGNLSPGIAEGKSLADTMRDAIEDDDSPLIHDKMAGTNVVKPIRTGRVIRGKSYGNQNNIDPETGEIKDDPKPVVKKAQGRPKKGSENIDSGVAFNADAWKKSAARKWGGFAEETEELDEVSAAAMGRAADYDFATQHNEPPRASGNQPKPTHNLVHETTGRVISRHASEKEAISAHAELPSHRRAEFKVKPIAGARPTKPKGFLNRVKGVFNEEEELDEVSGKLLGSYVQKARVDMRNRRTHDADLNADEKVKKMNLKLRDYMNRREYDSSGRSKYRETMNNLSDKIIKTKQNLDPKYPESILTGKRQRGIEKAISKLQGGKLTNEDVINIEVCKAGNLYEYNIIIDEEVIDTGYAPTEEGAFSLAERSAQQSINNYIDEVQHEEELAEAEEENFQDVKNIIKNVARSS